MKYLFPLVLLCAVNSSLAADPGESLYINPRVWNLGSMAQVDVWNTSDVDVECSGSITMYTRSGRSQHEYYWETIYRGFSRTRSYYLRNFNDRITTVFHTIQCRER